MSPGSPPRPRHIAHTIELLPLPFAPIKKLTRDDGMSSKCLCTMNCSRTILTMAPGTHDACTETAAIVERRASQQALQSGQTSGWSRDRRARSKVTPCWSDETESGKPAHT